jgi:putative glutamine amidotransferase
MKKPLIGINPYHIKRKGSFWNATKEDYYLTVWNSGGCPVTLNYPNKEEHISNIVEHLHGLLMVGGPDVPADVYGSTNPELLDKDQMSKEREFFDREVFLETLKQGKKVLAVCAGLQHINTVFGGTLTEDIPTLIPGAVDHGTFNGEYSVHEVKIKKESKLFNVLGVESVSVASTHHQCVNKLGDNIVSVASSSDGVVEAIEIENQKNFIGVQWHPELIKQSEETKKLFSWLLS